MDDGMEMHVAHMDQLLDDRVTGVPPLATQASGESSGRNTIGAVKDHDTTEEGAEHHADTLQGEGVASALASEITSPPAADCGTRRGANQDTQDRPVHESAIKFLVPNSLAGSLIGKGGATIKEIQLQASCMVRIASSGMYFPGTTERAVLVAGDTSAVKVACALILHTIHRPNKTAVSGSPSLLEENAADKIDLVQRLLIPLSAGGLIIGRKGANITALLKRSGAKVTLGQKNEAKANERVVTVQGNLVSATKATEMLVDKLREEPLTSRFANMSVNYKGQGHYHQAVTGASIAGIARKYPMAEQEESSRDGTPASADAVPDADSSVSSMNTPSTPVAEGVTQRSSSPSFGQEGSSIGVATSPMSGVVAEVRGATRRRQSLQHHHHPHSQQHQPQHPPHQQHLHQQQQQQQHLHHHHQQQQHLHLQQQQQQQQQHQQRQQPNIAKATIRGPTGPRPSAGAPQMTTMPSNMHIMAPGGPMPSPEQMRHMGPMRPLGHAPMHGMGLPYPPHPPHMGFQPGMHAPGMPTDPTAGGGSGGGPVANTVTAARAFPPHPQMLPFEPMTNPVAMALASCQPMTTVSVAIPVGMVGPILGRGGATINEMQSLSGARITVTQRNDFMPGTGNRILTISGPPMATQTAQYLVSHKIQSIASSIATTERPRRRGEVS